MKGISFWKSPVHWLFMKAGQLPLPLTLKIKIACWGVKWMTYRNHFKDQLLGELQVVVVSVDKDWQTVYGKHTETLVRDIIYRWKRKKLPFVYPKVFNGTQCKDETAHPLARVDHNAIAQLNDTIFEFNRNMAERIEQRENHRKLKDSIVNHQFQEYNHDL